MERQKRRLIIRIVAGLYLGYIAYSLLFGNEKEALLEFPFLIVAGIFFMAMAIIIVFFAAKNLKALNAQDLQEAREAAEAAELAEEARSEESTDE